MKESNSNRLPELDAFRGVAVLLVVIFHLTIFNPNINVSHFFKFGMTGVELFFMISGFVIFMTISHAQSGRDFWISRFSRLYPIYWFCLSLTTILLIIENLKSHTETIATIFYRYLVNFSMIQFYFNVQNMDGPYWSLMIELLFYLLLYLIYKLKLLAYTIPVLLLFVIFQSFVTISEHIIPGNTFTQYVFAGEKYFQLAYYLPLFLAGIVFYHLMFINRKKWLYMVLIICFLAQILEYDHISVCFFLLPRLQFITIIAVYFTMFTLFAIQKIQYIAIQPLIFLGRISYSLYLFHQFILLHFLLPFLNISCHIPYIISSLIALIIVVFIAWLNTRYVDEPLRKKVRVLLSNYKICHTY